MAIAPEPKPTLWLQRCHAMLCRQVGNDHHGCGIIAGIPGIVGLAFITAVSGVWPKLLVLATTLVVVVRIAGLIFDQEQRRSTRPSIIDFIVLPTAILSWCFIPVTLYIQFSLAMAARCGSTVIGFLVTPGAIVAIWLLWWVWENSATGFTLYPAREVITRWWKFFGWTYERSLVAYEQIDHLRISHLRIPNKALTGYRFFIDGVLRDGRTVRLSREHVAEREAPSSLISEAESQAQSIRCLLHRPEGPLPPDARDPDRSWLTAWWDFTTYSLETFLVSVFLTIVGGWFLLIVVLFVLAYLLEGGV